ncbi:MAG: nucleotidyltransferase family protein [Chloroflexaceae bacterium]|nr:nucleotidyltransferase family protein [Chloroflexaceae bacterium]
MLIQVEDVTRTLAQHREALVQFGVKTLFLFGSAARNEATENSDLDFLVEFDGEITFDRYINLALFLEDLFQKPVDLGTPRSLRPELCKTILQEAIRVA